jgi:hypothetical protein
VCGSSWGGRRSGCAVLLASRLSVCPLYDGEKHALAACDVPKIIRSRYKAPLQKLSLVNHVLAMDDRTTSIRAALNHH